MDHSTTIVTIVIALAGVAIQAAVGYFNNRTLVATYGTRLTAAEQNIGEIKTKVDTKAEKADLDRLRVSEVKQWDEITAQGKDISWLRAKVANGKAAGSSS